MQIAKWLGVSLASVFALAFGAIAPAPTASAETAGWSHTEGGPGAGRYSPLSEIDRSNVGQLEEVWRYRHGDQKSDWWRPDRVNRGTAFEGTPILVGRKLIFTTPFNRVIALDAATGAELWTFDPEIDRDGFYANMLINRGVALGRGIPDMPCAERVFLATLDARLIALDVATGKACADFGQRGEVDLTVGIEPLVDPNEYNVTSPPTVVGDLVIVGSSIADTVRRQAPPGDVRAYDALTGALRWTFHTIPHPGEFGAETWENASGRESGAANVWSTITADLERGLVFLPVSTPSPDFYGGDRPGANLFSDSLVALDAKTGERRWHFQTVHHDLWDYDLAAPPTLVTLERDGRPVDAVALATKQGFLFVLDRETGAPLFPVEERPVPQGGLPGEHVWPTQPFPTAPPALVPQRLTEADLWRADPKRHAECLEQFRSLRNEGLFTPPGTDGSILYPYTAGGANWSGSAWDPTRRLLVVPVNNLAHVIRLQAMPDDNVVDRGKKPIDGYWSGLQFMLSGRGTGLRYWLHPTSGRKSFKVDGVPCNEPPWGWLVAVDLRDGTIAWRVPSGSLDGVDGLPNFGHPLATGGGLVFHAGTREPALRAHDIETGAVLARFPLPAGLHAGPITYRLGDAEPQLLVVAPGGHVGVGSPMGDYVIAYALPEAARAAAQSPPSPLSSDVDAPPGSLTDD